MELSKTYKSSDYPIEELTLTEYRETNGGMLAVIGVGVSLVCGAIFLAPIAIAFYAGYHSGG